MPVIGSENHRALLSAARGTHRPAVRRVLVIGFDALDPGLLQRWAGTGRLPNFAALLRSSTWGETENPAAIYAGGVWPSFSTGVSPARHGRYFRYQVPRGGYAERYVPPGAVRAPAYWESASEAGRRVFVCDVPHARLSQRLRGVQLVDWSTHEPDSPNGFSSPPAFIDELRRRFGQPAPDRCDHVPPTPANARRLTRELLARIDSKVAIGVEQLGAGDWDLFTMVFCESHCVGHQFWSAHDATHPAHDPGFAAVAGDPMTTVYAALDAALGRLLEHAGAETFVLVFASHGIGPEYNESSVLDDVLRRLQGLPAPLPGALRQTMQASSRRMPTPLREAPIVRFARTRLHDWLQTRMLVRERMRRPYFQVPHNHNAGAIRINLAGRERYGTVQPGAEYRALRERLRAELSSLVDRATNRPVVERVVFTSEVFDGPFAADLPDLFVEWSRRGPVTEIGSPGLGWFPLPAFTQRTGDHSPRGLVLARASGLTPRRLVRPLPVTALAPTIAHLLGVAHAADSEPAVELIPADPA